MVHQMLRLLVAWCGVLDLNGRVPDSEVRAQPLLNGAHDSFRLGESLIRHHNVADAGYVFG